MCSIFFFACWFVLFSRGTANDRTEGQLAQPILELLQHLFPKQTYSGARTERKGLLAHTPSPAQGPLAASPWEGQPGCLRLSGQRLPWARVMMVLRPLPVARRGKKNAEPGKSLSVSSGVEGAGIDRAGAARACCCFGIGGERAVACSPFSLLPPLACPWRCVLIGATMLYNTYIIFQGKQCVSILRSHRYCVRGGGRQDLWRLVSGPPWLLLLILGIGGGMGERGPTPHQSSAAEKEELAGQPSSTSCALVLIAQGIVCWSGCHSCASKPAFCSWGPPLWQMGVVR